MKRFFEFLVNMFVWFYLITLVVVVVGVVLIYPKIMLLSLIIGVLMAILNLMSSLEKSKKNN